MESFFGGGRGDLFEVSSLLFECHKYLHTENCHLCILSDSVQELKKIHAGTMNQTQSCD